VSCVRFPVEFEGCCGFARK